MTRTTEKDKGRAWLILCMAFLNNILATGVFSSSAVYMVDWEEYFDASKAKVGLISAVFASVACVSGFFTGPLVNRIGCKKLCIIGTTIDLIALISSAFVQSIGWLYFTFGLLLGIGHACHFIPPIIIIQDYFDKKRPLATGISLSGHSIGNFIMLPFLRFLIEKYGWRGALWIHAGLIMHTYILAITYTQPHIQDKGSEEKSPNENSEINQYIVNGSVDTTKPTGLNQSDQIKVRDFNSSIKSVEVQHKKSNCLTKLRTFVTTTWDINLLKNPLFLQVVFALILPGFTIDVMFKFSPLKAVANGIDKTKASFLPSMIGLSSTISSLIASFVVNLPCVNRVLSLGTALICEGIITLVSCLAWNYISLLVVTSFFGIFLGLQITLATTVVVDLFGVRQLPHAHAFISGFVAVVMITSLSTTGLIADVTQNYDLPNYIHGTVGIFAGILMVTVPITQKRQKKQKSKDDKDQEAMEKVFSMPRVPQNVEMHLSLQSIDSLHVTAQS